MYSNMRSAAVRSASDFMSANTGTCPVIGTTIPGLVPQVTKGNQLRGINLHDFVILRTRIRGKLTPVCNSFVPVCALGCETSAFEIGEGGFVRSDHSCTCPASMLMLQTVMRPSMESARTASPAYSITYPVAPSVPIWPMMPRIKSLADTPSGNLPLT